MFALWQLLPVEHKSANVHFWLIGVIIDCNFIAATELDSTLNFKHEFLTLY
jgi:hypothetical protein